MNTTNSTADSVEAYRGPQLSSWEQGILLAAVVLGLAANSSILVVFGHSRQLHNPRNLCWMFIMISNMLLTFQGIIELATAFFQSVRLCYFYVFFYGIPYGSLTNCLIMATLDRFATIQWPIFYKTRITTPVVCCSFSVMFVLTFLVLTSPYWLLIDEIQCTPVRSGLFFEAVIVFFLPLCLLCMLMHVWIYVRTMRHIRSYPKIFNRKRIVVYRSSKSSCTLHTSQTVRNNTENVTGNFKPEITKLRSRTSPVQSLSRPELQAALTLILGLILITIIGPPQGVFFLWRVVCKNFAVEKCSVPLYGLRFIRPFTLLHSVYSPLVYWATCSEFRTAASRLTRRIRGKL